MFFSFQGIECHVCSDSFVSIESLRVHIRTCQKGRMRCETCGYLAAGGGRLTKHMQICIGLNNDGVPQEKCPHCSKVIPEYHHELRRKMQDHKTNCKKGLKK